MSEPVQLELSATPLPPAIRALCFGGPWNGSVMMAPVLRTTLFGGLALAVRIDGRSAHFRSHADAQAWIGGVYVLTTAGAETQRAARHVAALIGEPKDTGVCWTWYEHADDYDVCLLTERMVKVHVLEAPVPEDPYEPTAAVRGLMDEYNLDLMVHPDGDVSFRTRIEGTFDFRDLDEIDRLLKETDG